MEKDFLELGSSDGNILTIPLKYLNRHGIIAGSTGTGKSRSMQLLAEQLTERGVIVFVSDVKGDVCGFGKAGEEQQRNSGSSIQPHPTKTNYWSVGKRFIPLRFSISEVGAVLLSKFLELNQTQESHLSLVFSYARKNGSKLDSLSDLSGFLSKIEKDGVAGISSSSIAVIQRKLIVLEESQIGQMFGKPPLEITDLKGLNVLNMADSRKDMSATLAPLFLLNKMFNELPEIGDQDQPKFMIFIDEAHYLLKDSNKSVKNLISTILKQIRSKGVGVFFITQEVGDIPEDILGLLATKIIFAQKILTEKGISKLKAIAKSFPKSSLDVFEELKALPTGFAVFSTLDANGTQITPNKVIVFSPSSSMEVLDDAFLKNNSDQKLISKYQSKNNSTESRYIKPNSEAKETKKPKQQTEVSKVKNNSKILDDILSGFLKIIKFILEALSLIFEAIVKKPLIRFVKYLTKKPIRILWFLVFLLLVYIVYVNWSIIAAFLSSLNFSK